jgi:hypothetical protein
MRSVDRFTAFPGGDLIAQGVQDLALQTESVDALLVSIGAPRLRAAGMELPQIVAAAERRLCDRLAAEDCGTPHGQYNAFVRHLASFEHAVECARP